MTWGSNGEPDPPNRTWVMFAFAFIIWGLIVAARWIAGPSWLMPAVLIAILALAVVSSLLFVGGVLIGESRAPRPMTDEDFACWTGDPIRPSSWPYTGAVMPDGSSVQRAPNGEEIIIEPDGRILSVADHLAGRII